MNAAIDRPVVAPGRLPAWALGLSLAVHLAVLAAPFLQRRTEAVDLPALAVSFRPPAVPAAAARTPEPERIVPPAPPASAGERSRPPRPPVTLPAPAIPAVEPATGERAAERAPVAVAATTPGAERNEATPAARPGEAAPAAENADAAAMARYVRLLGDLLARQQQYPRLAAARGWEGEVRLRLQVARKGTIIAVHIVHSSGFDVLDQHAVQLVQNAALPPPPANGGSPDFLVDIPIHYALKRS